MSFELESGWFWQQITEDIGQSWLKENELVPMPWMPQGCASMNSFWLRFSLVSVNAMLVILSVACGGFTFKCHTESWQYIEKKSSIFMTFSFRKQKAFPIKFWNIPTSQSVTKHKESNQHTSVFWDILYYPHSSHCPYKIRVLNF